MRVLAVSFDEMMDVDGTDGRNVQRARVERSEGRRNEHNGIKRTFSFECRRLVLNHCGDECACQEYLQRAWIRTKCVVGVCRSELRPLVSISPNWGRPVMRPVNSHDETTRVSPACLAFMM